MKNLCLPYDVAMNKFQQNKPFMPEKHQIYIRTI